MPSLSDVLRTNLAGYAPATNDRPLPQLPVPRPGKGNFGTNPSIRCPLPPFNIGPDTLRQFDQSEGTTPRRRVIPLPVTSQVGGGTTVINNSTVTTGSGSSTSASLTAKTVTYTSPLLVPGASDSQSIVMAKSFQLISMVSNVQCEMRLYGSAASQSTDISRPQDSPVAAEVFNNIITDIVFDASPYVWEWQNRVGVNTDVPQGKNIYITTFNTGVASAQILITITFLPLEA